MLCVCPKIKEIRTASATQKRAMMGVMELQKDATRITGRERRHGKSHRKGCCRRGIGGQGEVKERIGTNEVYLISSEFKSGLLI